MNDALLGIAEEDKKDGLNFVKNGIFFIYGVFDNSIAKDIIPELIKEIDSQKRLKDGIIKFYIDSCGGQACYLYNLLALIESAKSQGIIVETYVFGRAYSCGSLLACAGTKDHRFISYLTEHLAHLGYAGAVAANDVELERQSGRVKAHFDRVRDLYRKYANLENLEEVIKFDDYFIRGGDIIKNGLADKFVD